MSQLQGVGIGLRECHYSYILKNHPDIAWFEALSDNYFNDEQAALVLETLRQNYPIALHSVGMSLGSTDSLNFDYLKKLKQLAERIQPAVISDHLSWVSVNGQYLHDLIPLPMTDEVVNHVSERILRVQDFLGQKILIENPSSYLEYEQSVMPEWEFINAIVEKADCYILLDINNIVVSAFNSGFSAEHYIKNINPKRVKQFHLAGYSDEKEYLFDMHNQAIHAPVWDLYQKALQQFGAVPTLIERDSNIPPFPELYAEAKKAETLMQSLESVC